MGAYRVKGFKLFRDNESESTLVTRQPEGVSIGEQ